VDDDEGDFFLREKYRRMLEDDTSAGDVDGIS
jgi:hypothetical protein